MGAHHRAFRDLGFTNVMEDLGDIVVGPLVSVDFWTLSGLSTHPSIMPHLREIGPVSPIA